jgi:hypothetical protein
MVSNDVTYMADEMQHCSFSCIPKSPLTRHNLSHVVQGIVSKGTAITSKVTSARSPCAIDLELT